MKKTILILIYILSFKVCAQEVSIKFYNENGHEITKEVFINTRDYSKNIDIYFGNDTREFGFLVKRKNYGKLTDKLHTQFRTYLNKLSGNKLDSTKSIVINYLSAIPRKKETGEGRSRWNIFNKDYLKRLHKITDVMHFWINSPSCDNLKYHYSNKINWLSDTDKILSKLFFPYDIKYGYYVLIKPNGDYFYYLGEYGKKQVWDKVNKFLK